MISPIFFSEWWRMFRRSIYVKKNGFKRYKGDAEAICKQILEDCYNSEKKFYQVSDGHFTLFYTRDFAWITESLIRLGHKDRVRSTLSYALKVFRRYGKITTTISKNDKPFDFPKMAIDSIPYLVYSLACLGDSRLVSEYKDFLEDQIKLFCKYVVDQNTGMIMQNIHFSSMKDYSKRSSSCYDNCMLHLLSKSCDKLRLINPLSEWEYEHILIDNFWNGEYFYDDLKKRRYVAGDANTFPFWVGAVKNKEILKKVISKIHEEDLDNPFPLKYTKVNRAGDYIGMEIFAGNYEGNTVWMHMGPLYVEIVGRVDKKLQSEYIIGYKNVIERFGNFLEVFNPDGSPYKLPYYVTDESMSWCANYLTLAIEDITK
ncbi:hypothetical protein H6503_02700 [Candidatus Woesearchaeota archaeon]|nr:hypothetical protein [Candidatus Woesearchaeota archaeon]